MNDAVHAPRRSWLSVARRHLIVVGAWAVIAAVAVGAMLAIVPSQHQASGQVLLLPPAQPTLEGQRRNPYLVLPDGLILTSNLLANSVGDEDVRRELRDQGFASEYSVIVVPGTGPLIAITVKDTDPQRALELRDLLAQRLIAELAQIQADEDVPQAQLIEARLFTASQQADRLLGNRIRAAAAAAIAVFVLAALTVWLLDVRSRRRRAQIDSQRGADTDLASPA